MGKLDGAIAYLSGAITFVSDDGICWRQDLKNKCKLAIPRLEFFDPTDKPPGLEGEIGFEKYKALEWKKNGQFDEITEHVKEYRRVDLRMVDNSNFLIVYVDLDAYTVGTWDEVVTCERQCHPILAIIKQGKKNAPDWLFAMMRHEEMFESVQECVDYLAKLDCGEIKMDKRWVLFNKQRVGAM